MATPKPIVLKFTAKKDPSVDSSLKSINQKAEGLADSFSQASYKSEEMNRILKQVAGSSVKLGRGFDKTTSLSEVLAKSLDKVGKGSKKAAGDAKELRYEFTKGFKAFDSTTNVLDDISKSLDRVSGRAGQAGDAIKDAVGSVGEAPASRPVSEGFDLSQVVGIGEGISTAAESASGILSDVAKNLSESVITVAELSAEFEALEGSIVLVTGSTEKAAEAFKFADNFKGFDTRSTVAATKVLEKYGQTARTILPKIANLAAGTSQSLEETAEAVATGFGGSADDFRELLSTYKVSTVAMRRYGAEVSSTGELLLDTTRQVNKARDAFLQINEIRFGGSAAEQADTFAGAMADAKDSIEGLGSELGVGAASVAKFGASFVGGGFELLRKLPDSVKEGVGAALALSAGFAALTAAAVSLGVSVIGLSAAMNVLKSTGLGLQGTLFLVEQGLARLGVGAVATSFLTLLGPITAAVAVFGALYYATERSIEQSLKQDAQIKEEIILFQKRVQQRKELTKAVDDLAAAEAKAAGVPEPKLGGFQTSEDRINKLKSVLDTASGSEFFARFAKAGLDAKSVASSIGDIGDQAKAEAANVKALTQALRESRSRDAAINSSGLPGVDDTVSLETRTLETKLQIAQRNVKTLDEEATSLKLIDERYKDLEDSVNSLSNSSARARDFMKYSDQIGDVDALNSSLQVLTQNIDSSAKALEALNEPSDRDSLIEKLRTGAYEGSEKGEELKARVIAYLDLLNDQANREEDLQKKSVEGEKQKLREIQSALDDARAAREVSAAEELASLEKQQKIAVKLGSDGAAELTAIKRRQATIRKIERQKEVEETKDTAAEILKTAAELPMAAKTSERGTQKAVNAYSAAITRVEEWIVKNKELIAQFPELGIKGEAAIEQLKLGKAAAEVARTGKNFELLRNQIADLSRDADTTTAKLEAVGKAQALLKNAKGAGNITEDQADEIGKDLDRSKGDLTKTKVQEEIRLKSELMALAEESAKQELALAETVSDGSVASTNKLLVLREKLFNFRVSALENERDLAIAAGEDKATAEEKFALKVANLERSKTLTIQQELKKRFDAERQTYQDIIDIGKAADDKSKTSLDFFGGGTAFSIGGQSKEDRDASKAGRVAQKDLDKLERKRIFEQLNPEAAKFNREAERNQALNAADPSGLIRRVKDTNKSAAKETIGRTPGEVSDGTQISIYNNLSVKDNDPDVQALSKASVRLMRKEKRIRDLTGASAASGPLGYGAP